MLLGGLWHGASWNFMVWGGYHGALLSVERLLRGDRRVSEQRSWAYPLQAALTFVLVIISWVFFRSANLTESVLVIGQMFSGAAGKLLLEPWHIGMALAALGLAVAEERRGWFERVAAAPGWAYAVTLAAMLFCMEAFGVIDASIPFIYFQF
jgi:D-alanyl-lipoteichoic acid acyltransferase DltB (MBOAT superfamily)